MATISNLTLSIVKNVANADITADWTINWDSFDQQTDLPWSEKFTLIGDDTGQDGDDGPVGDDPISIGSAADPVTVSSNGQASVSRTKNFTIAFSKLNEDNVPVFNVDDEIRAVVTLTPQLPVATSRESAASVFA